MKMFCYHEVCVNSCGITVWQPDWSWDTARHPFGDYDLWTVLKGDGFLTADGVSHPVTAGSCLFLRPHGRYVGRQNPSSRLTVLNIHFDFLEDGCPVYATPDAGPPLYRQLFDFDFFQKLLYKVLNFSSAGENRMAAHWLQAALDEIALQLGYKDICFFTRQFRRHVGVTPSAYRQASRLAGEGS